jgi:hypothetical protein
MGSQLASQSCRWHRAECRLLVASTLTLVVLRVHHSGRGDVQGEAARCCKRLTEQGPELIARQIHGLGGGVNALVNAYGYLSGN